MPQKGERLQKYMARCGAGSRRKCEELIREGKVSVNGSIPELGSNVGELDVVELDGKVLRPKDNIYYMVHKPEGVVCSNVREGGRKRVIDLIPGAESQGLFTVGRLDVETSGLILVTNDGNTANRLIHPSRGLEKEYVVFLKGGFGPRDVKKIQEGIDIGEERPAMAIVKNVVDENGGARVWLILYEGRFRIIRRMMKSLNKKVVSLQRIRIGTLELGDLAPGDYAVLSPEDLASLSATCSQ